MSEQMGNTLTIKDREDYFNLRQAASLLEMTEYAVGAMKGVIGFRRDPDDPSAPLFHIDDLRTFMDEPNYRIYLGFEIFTNPGLIPRDDDEMVDLWLVKKVERLCKQYTSGDEEGHAKTTQEINSRMVEDR